MKPFLVEEDMMVSHIFLQYLAGNFGGIRSNIAVEHPRVGGGQLDCRCSRHIGPILILQ